MKKILSTLFAIAIVGLVLGQCDGAHSAIDDMSWLSCQGTENPNSSRTEEHWIMYDFGANYHLNESHFWNYNQSGETENGIATVAIDYSNDGQNWTWWGDLNLDEAPGSDDYFGEEGPNFEGLLAKYFCFRSSNHGGPCYGFSRNNRLIQVNWMLTSPAPRCLSLAHIQIQQETQAYKLIGFGTQISLYSPRSSYQQPLALLVMRHLRDLAPGVYLVEVVKSDGARATQRLTVVN